MRGRARRTRCSDLEQLALLAREERVHLVNVRLGEGLELLLGAPDLVLAGLAVARDAVSSSLARRRTLRIATRESSAFALASFTKSRRRSSVRAGSTTRMTLPSLEGFTPRSESRSDFSTAVIELLSNGETRIVRASVTVNDASCCSGVGAP